MQPDKVSAQKRNQMIQKARRERLAPHNLLPCVSPRKIKVRIFAMNHQWIALRSLCMAFKDDDKYDLLISIWVPSWQEGMDNDNRKDGIKCVLMKEYNIEDDKPDIAILESDKSANKIVREFIKKSAVHAKTRFIIPFNLLMSTGEAVESRVGKIYDNTRKNDFYIFDRFLYAKATEKSLLNSNIVHIGNPKFDEIYEKMQAKQVLPEEWEKLRGKKVFVWTTDHAPLDGNVTFDFYASYFLEWFYAHKDDCALIIRPHPLLVNELIRNNIWKREDYEAFKAYCEGSENIVLDGRVDYCLSYSLADCIFTDANCGIIITGMTIDKPICALLRNDKYAHRIVYPEIIEHHNLVSKPEELYDFLERIRAGEDPKADLRKVAFSKFISHYDGQNGQRIKDFIEEKYVEIMDKGNQHETR